MAVQLNLNKLLITSIVGLKKSGKMGSVTITTIYLNEQKSLADK